METNLVPLAAWRISAQTPAESVRRESSGDRPAVQRCDDVGDDGRAGVVEDLVGSEPCDAASFVATQ